MSQLNGNRPPEDDPHNRPWMTDVANGLAERLGLVRLALSLLPEWEDEGFAIDERTRKGCLEHLQALVQELAASRHPEMQVCLEAVQYLNRYGSERAHGVLVEIAARLDEHAKNIRPLYF